MLKPNSYVPNCAGVNGSVNLLSLRQAETMFATTSQLPPNWSFSEMPKRKSAKECQPHRIQDASLFP